MQKFREDQIGQIEAFLESDNDLFIFLNDYFVEMSKQKTMMKLLPNFSKELHLARKSQKHLILINELIIKIYEFGQG